MVKDSFIRLIRTEDLSLEYTLEMLVHHRYGTGRRAVLYGRVRACVRVCVRACVRVRACVCVRVRACVCACVRVHARALSLSRVGRLHVIYAPRDTQRALTKAACVCGVVWCGVVCRVVVCALAAPRSC